MLRSIVLYTLIVSILFIVNCPSLANSDSYPNNDSLQCKELFDQYKQYIDVDLDSALKYATAFQQRISTTNDIKLQSRALSNLGYVHELKGNTRDALKLYEQAYEFNKTHQLSDGYIENLNDLGNVHESLSENDKALTYYLEAYELAQTNKDTDGKFTSLINLALLNYYLDKNDQAIEYYSECLEIALTLQDSSKLPVVYNNLGLVYYDQRELEKAIEQFRKAVSINEVLGNDTELADNTMNIGLIFYELGQLDKAQRFFNYALAVDLRTGNVSNEIVSRNNLGELFLEMELPDSTIYHANISLRLARNAEDLASETDGLNLLAQAWERKGDVSKSLEFYKAMIMTNDSLKKVQKEEQVAELEAKYQTEKKELLNQQLSKDVELKEKERNLLFYIGISSLLLLALFIVGFISKRKDNQIIKEQKEQVELQHKEITDSINYSKRIQYSLLPSNEKLKAAIPDSFVLYLPKDVVSGDFYGVGQVGDKNIVAAIDCTGHGVSGAFVSIVAYKELSRLISSEQISKPSELLNQLDEGVSSTLNQERSEKEEAILDGMDIALCTIDPKANTLEFAGAVNSLVHLRADELHEIKGDRMPIGGNSIYGSKSFTNHHVDTKAGDVFYLFSDGFQDQFGGEKGKKYMAGRFRKFLQSIHKLPMKEQHEKLLEEFDNWKGAFEQVDDVLVMGFKV